MSKQVQSVKLLWPEFGRQLVSLINLITGASVEKYTQRLSDGLCLASVKDRLIKEMTMYGVNLN
ncbi:hypothetical protein Hdeb2414_s0010g00336321 [Helianthus debilis subsp. tardiflorus]